MHYASFTLQRVLADPWISSYTEGTSDKEPFVPWPVSCLGLDLTMLPHSVQVPTDRHIEGMVNTSIETAL